MVICQLKVEKVDINMGLFCFKLPFSEGVRPTIFLKPSHRKKAAAKQERLLQMVGWCQGCP